MTPTFPIELTPPDIDRWRAGNSGVDYVHRFTGAAPGPRVMVQALTHGNEICGAIALDRLLADMPPVARGTLTLAFANVAAYERFDSDAPQASRCVDEDLNRVWSDAELDGPRDSTELRRARELRPFVDEAELLLDIHSMTEACEPLMVCGQVDKNAAYARELGVPGVLLIDTGHAAGLRMIERGGFGDPASPRKALLIECGQHWEQSSAAVAWDTLLRFLRLTGSVDAPWVESRLERPLPTRQRLVRVTEAVAVQSADFRLLVPPVGLSEVEKAGTPIAQDGAHVWRAPYDRTVLVMPAITPPKPGTTAVRLGRWED